MKWRPPLIVILTIVILAAAVIVILYRNSSTDTDTKTPDESGLMAAIQRLAVAEEVRKGYSRDSFRHWIDEDGDGCSTRAEVLIEEAIVAPKVGQRCALSGGKWFSYYDGTYVEGADSLDVDHMVPLAEAWDSGAYAWTPEQRMHYANDLVDAQALVAVSARSNRSKSDQDPASWLPPAPEAHCRYITDWVTVKTRWSLTIDQAEKAALVNAANSCANATMTTTPTG